MSVVIPHKNSQYFHPDASFLAKYLLTVFLFHHWTLDFGHPMSLSLTHCRPQPVLEIENEAKNVFRGINLPLFPLYMGLHTEWLKVPRATVNLHSLPSPIKMMTRKNPKLND